MAIVLGIDLGGTNVKGIAMHQNGEIINQYSLPTHDNGDESWRNNVKLVVEELKNQLSLPISCIGISAPGLPDSQNKCIAYLPNRLSGLENFIWENYLGEKTFVINDAHSALMAEVRFGVAKGKQNVVLLTLGTGVGGGILINGELYQGLSQMAGHLGHISVSADNQDISIVGMPGSLEFAIGNYSVATRTLNRFQTTADLVNAHLEGDYLATYCWLSSVKKLSVAIASLINAFSPEMIVLSGGISLAKDALLNPLHQFIDLYEWRPGGKKTPIELAHFSDMAGAIGAASFAFSKMD